jgi:hypothetical protein
MIGNLVLAKRDGDRDYTEGGIKLRKKFTGQKGVVTRESNAHGLCYEVLFEKGTAWFDPDELTDLGKPEVKMQAPEECVAEMMKTAKTRRKPDFTVTNAELSTAWNCDISTDNSEGVVIRWESKSAGFGEITIQKSIEGEMTIDAECMSKDFVKAVFNKLIDQLMPEKKNAQGKETG